MTTTNDILTSAFAQATSAGILLMAINLRNRTEGVVANDAGNYESVVIYDPPSTATPELIRQSLRAGVPFTRVGGAPLPDFFKLLGTRFAIIMNWAFPVFKADLKLLDEQGHHTCGLQLHLPIYDPAAVPCPMAIIFRPCAGKLAMWYAGNQRDLSYERLIACGAPLGERVGEALCS